MSAASAEEAAAGAAKPAAPTESAVPAAVPASAPSKRRSKPDEPYANSIWKQFLLSNERIIFTGVITKKKSMWSLERKRQLILTSLPRFVYVDPEKMEYKNDIPWDDVETTLIDEQHFTIKTPHRTYVMKGLSTGARAWVDEIEKMRALMQARTAERMASFRPPPPMLR